MFEPMPPRVGQGFSTSSDLILIRGLPGSGKSTLASAISHYLEPRCVEILDPDLVDRGSKDFVRFGRLCAASGVPNQIHVYRYLLMRTGESIRAGRTVIWSQAFTNRTVFASLLSSVRAFPAQPSNLLALEMRIDPQLAYGRVIQRQETGGNFVPRERFDQLTKHYESFADLDVCTLPLRGECQPAENALRSIAILRSGAARATYALGAK